jgi:MFS family permease
MGVHAPVDMRAVAMAVLMIASSLTQSMSGFVSGYVTERWGFEGTVMIASGVSIGAGLILLMGRKRLRFQRRRAAPDPGTPETAGAGARPRDALRYTFFLGSYGLIFFISFGIFDAYVPLYATSAVMADATKVGALFGLRGLVQTVLLLPMGRLADKRGKPIFMMAGMVTVALSTAGIAFSTSYTMLAACAVLFSLSMTLYFPSVAAMLAERIPVQGLGTAMGFYGLMEDVGWMMGPALGGMLWEAWGMQSPFLFGGAIAAVAAPTYALLRSRFEPAVGRGRGAPAQTQRDPFDRWRKDESLKGIEEPLGEKGTGEWDGPPEKGAVE